MEEWMETFSFQTLIDNLETIGVPSGIIDGLEYLEEMDKDELLYYLF